MSYQHLVHFTISEAQSMLPAIVQILTRMRDCKRALDARGYDIRGHRYFGGMGMNGTKVYPDEMEEILKHYHDLSTKGVVLKDIDRGLIDFPALRSDGEEVYLCYMLGEPKIAFWHRIEEGFPGRQSIDQF